MQCTAGSSVDRGVGRSSFAAIFAFWFADRLRRNFTGRLSPVARTAELQSGISSDGKLAGGGALPDIGLYCLNFARFVPARSPSDGCEPSKCFPFPPLSVIPPRFQPVSPPPHPQHSPRPFFAARA